MHIDRRGCDSKSRIKQFPKEVESDLLQEVQRQIVKNAYLKMPGFESGASEIAEENNRDFETEARIHAGYAFRTHSSIHIHILLSQQPADQAG